MKTKYYKITSENFISKAKEYKKEIEKLYKITDIIWDEFGIETRSFYPRVSEFKIEPTRNDVNKFREMLKKDGSTFKKNSLVNKRFEELVKEYQAKTPYRPMLWDYAAHTYGSMAASHFEIDGVHYGSLEIEGGGHKTVEGFEEMKASEFYKIIEDYEERVKENKEAKND